MTASFQQFIESRLYDPPVGKLVTASSTNVLSCGMKP